MRELAIYLWALGSLSSTYGLSHGSAQLRDMLAYPKYQVSFLNHLPVSVSDAAKARAIGIEKEEEWLSQRLSLPEERTLSDGSGEGETTGERLQIVPMNIPHTNGDEIAEYLCLMPSRNTTESQIPQRDERDHEELDPVQSWAALSHLENKCLYSKQGWFTYACVDRSAFLLVHY